MLARPLRRRGGRDERRIDATGGHAETEKATEALPGGAEVDRELVLEAIGHVARLRNGSTLEGWLEIGDYLLDAFFGGSIEQYRAQAPHHASFRALADRHDLPVSRVALWRAVSVAEQVRELEPDVGRALPFTHHTLLLSVSDPELKHRLARTCVAESWSKRRLETEVRRVRGPTRRGRKAAPKIAKAVGLVARTASSRDGLAGLTELSTLSRDQLLSIREDLALVESWLARIRLQVEATLRR